MVSSSSRVRAAILIKSLYANISHHFCTSNGSPHPVDFPAAGQNKMLAFAKLYILSKHCRKTAVIFTVSSWASVEANFFIPWMILSGVEASISSHFAIA